MTATFRSGCRLARRLRAISAVAAVLGALAGCGSGSSDSARQPTTRATSTPTSLAGVRPSAGCQSSGDSTTSPAPGASGAATSAAEKSITVDGTARTYVLSDDGVDSGMPAPVVVVLHGMGQSPDQIDSYSQFPAGAAARNMIVLTPAAGGSPSMWQPSGTSPDAAFITAMLEKVGATHCVDEARVYLAGFSVGAFMAAAYACANEDRVAAVAALSVQFPGDCKRPMPIVAFHGTADPIVPYAPGAKGAVGGGAGTEANMATWARIDGCTAEPTEDRVAAKVVRVAWQGCKASSQVVLYRVEGGGHAWPGSTADPADAVPAAASVDATKIALAFFARHHR